LHVDTEISDEPLDFAVMVDEIGSD